MLEGLDDFEEIWCVDFEWTGTRNQGNPPRPVCLVGYEMRTGRYIRQWRDDFGELPPYRTDANVLLVAFNSSAEMWSHIALGWLMNESILDLYVERKALVNNTRFGSRQLGGLNLPATMRAYKLDSITVEEKRSMIDLILDGDPYTPEQEIAILDYCQSDVDALKILLPAMLPDIDIPCALHRGEYMRPVAEIQFNGIPLDLEMLDRIERNKGAIRNAMIVDTDQDYGVFVDGKLNQQKFAQWLTREGIPWPLTETGKLATDEETFRQAEKSYPQVAKLKQLLSFLGDTKKLTLKIGDDGRSRYPVFPFEANTGRNQPRDFIFAKSAYLRSVIKPAEGRAIANLDYKAQEFAIAAGLSKDPKMMAAYTDGDDPYLEFAKQVGAVPEHLLAVAAAMESFPEDHPDRMAVQAIRDKFKVCALGVLYGQQKWGLAERMGSSPFEANEILKLHRDTYDIFWKWSDAAVRFAVGENFLYTKFGWNIRVLAGFERNALLNFPMQGNASDMLRLACIMLSLHGIKIIAPIHDAVMIESSVEKIDEDAELAAELMMAASRIVLDGLTVRVDTKVVKYPDRYMDKRGKEFWSDLMKRIEEIEHGNPQ